MKNQSGVTSNTVVKTALTVAAIGTTTYSGVLGARIAAAGEQPAQGETKPAHGTPENVRQAQSQQRVLQWLTPALPGIMIVLGSQQGEQQRPGERLRGVHDKTVKQLAGVLAKIAG